MGFWGFGDANNNSLVTASTTIPVASSYLAQFRTPLMFLLVLVLLVAVALLAMSL